MTAASDDRWVLANPHLVIDLLRTRHGPAGAIDDLADDRGAAAWVREHADLAPVARTTLVRLRERFRDLLTVVVNGAGPPAATVRYINDLAAQVPVTLAGQINHDGTIDVRRTSRGPAAAVLGAELARSALALLHGPARRQVALCRAPGCTWFFLRQDGRQRWCSPSCGNRARVARHYARHNHSDDPPDNGVRTPPPRSAR